MNVGYNSCIKATTMKKSAFKKFIKNSLKKLKEHKQLKKFKLSNYKEDFVITEQEEREGGFFGNLSFKPAV